MIKEAQPHCCLNKGYIEFKYYADAIHSDLIPLD